MSETATIQDLYASASPWLLAGIVATTGILSLQHYSSLPRLVPQTPSVEEDATLPSVSIIVPARNEEHTLPTLLRSLLTQEYPNFEVVVVDDASTDATSSIAAEFAQADSRVRVVQGSGPALGWTGKNYACYQGAQAASGEWLLFTDADTEHTPDALRAAITAARASGASAVSLFPRQQCVGFWERLLLPFAYQQYFAGVRPLVLHLPNGPALANGQYFLIARAAYDVAGGHASVAASIIDDVALAGALKSAGFPPFVFRGEQLVRVRMYESLGALVEGFTKNAFQFLQEQQTGSFLVVLGTACAAGIIPAAIGALLAGSPVAVSGVLAAYLLQGALLVPWLRTFGVPLRYAALGPLAALAFTGIALSSTLHALARRPVQWKGRAVQPLLGGKSGATESEVAHVE